MKKYIAIDGINGEEELFDTIEDARADIMDVVVDDEFIHPDAESCYIVEVIEVVEVVEVVDPTDEYPFYKVNLKSNKQ
jgi:hypothetical protein